MRTYINTKKDKKRWTRGRLLAFGVPAVLIPGMLIAITLGWNPTKLLKTSDYHAIRTVFPSTGVVKEVADGDTFMLVNGVQVRLIGIDAPDRGDKNYDQSREYLRTHVENQRVYLEYDRYQDDKYGRVLAWVWTECERVPTFFPEDYMHLTYNTSRPGLLTNPQGCTEGTLVNEMMVDAGLANAQVYKARGELKYEKRLQRSEY